jgi:hypothetical protein
LVRAGQIGLVSCSAILDWLWAAKPAPDWRIGSQPR